MVSFKKLIATAFLFSTVIAIPAINSIGSAERESSSIDANASITKRVPSQQLLQWAPDGTILYLLGTLGSIATLLAEIQHMITVGQEGSPAQVLLESFAAYVRSNSFNLHPGAFDLFINEGQFNPGGIRFGAVYNIIYEGVQAVNLWGFGFTFAANNVPQAADLAGLVDAIRRFAEQDGGVVTIIQRANGFFNPTNIGAGIALDKRTRNDNCPALIDLLQYTTADVPQDLDYNTSLKWLDPCIGTQT